MKKNYFIILIIAAMIAGCSKPKPTTKIWLPKIIGSNMVLQREKPISIWGKADTNSLVQVIFKGKKYDVTSDDKGNWIAELDEQEAGGPFEMQIIGKDTLTLTNILIGEVWICSGQSNMQWNLGRDKNAATELPKSANPQIRLFRVNTTNSLVPNEDCSSSGWHESVPDSAALFSAVGYYFGKNLQNSLKIPVGLIESAWGGSLVEAWTRADSLMKYDEFVTPIKMMQAKSATPSAIPADSVLYKKYMEKVKIWENDVKTLIEKENQANIEFLANAKTDDWKSMDLPRFWESTDVGTFDGIIWFVKNIEIPKKWVGKSLTIKLGTIDDIDVTYVNGVNVGSRFQYNEKRVYEIPASASKKNMVIAVKAFDVSGGGGFSGKKEELVLKCGKDSISLCGTWNYSIAGTLENFPKRPMGAVAQQIPFTVYNAMIHPLVPYSIRGAIWYQGESNADRPVRYRSLLQTMINSWRAEWNADFDFIVIQLPNYMDAQVVPGESSWALIREAQFMATKLYGVENACIIDLGDPADIHPTDKSIVGYRTALVALNKSYGEDVEYSGPRFKEMKIEGNKAIISFDHISKGFMINGTALKGFTIAGEDKVFHWADAVLQGTQVVLTCKDVQVPVAVRYNWADNPGGNLYNQEGLPAFSFRTDNWPVAPEILKTNLLINLEEIYK